MLLAISFNIVKVVKTKGLSSFISELFLVVHDIKNVQLKTTTNNSLLMLDFIY